MIKRKCPKCGSKDIARIVYGVPSFSKIIKSKEKVHIGGCCIPEPFPTRHCEECGYKFAYISIFGNDLSKEKI